MRAADGMHYSATFHGDTCAMAACRETLGIVDRERVQEHCERLGQRLIDGLNALARELDVPAEAYGEPLPAMPFFRFMGPTPEHSALMTKLFFREALARGVLLHPRHLWFISGAHTERDIDYTVTQCRLALLDALAMLDG
jgi:glutamate-1-semialdehyde aminotransferase